MVIYAIIMTLIAGMALGAIILMILLAFGMASLYEFKRTQHKNSSVIGFDDGESEASETFTDKKVFGFSKN